MPLAVQCNFVSPGDPPACVVGVPYSHFFTQSGGAGLFYIFPGILPSGLTLNSTTGEVSGTPDGADFAPGATFKQSGLTVSVFDPGTLQQASIACGITAFLNCIQLVPFGNPPGGATGVLYSFAFGANFGIAPYTFAVTGGALPGGLTLSAGGTVSGTPTTNGHFTFFVTVTGSGDPTNNVATFAATIIIGGGNPNKSPQLYFYGFGFAGPLGIGCNNPPDAVQGVAYDHFLSLLPSGVPPYVFSISAGALPTGLSLNSSTAEITGTPSVSGLFNFTARVTDADLTFADVGCSILVHPPLTLSCGNPPDGTVGVAYDHFLVAAGGVLPYTFAITAGALPTGLSLDASTGEITGTPSIGGTFPFTVGVTDSYAGGSGPDVVSVNCSIFIANVSGLMIVCNNPPSGNIGISYAHTFPATSGIPPYTFAIVAGALPPGLMLDASTGVIAGTPMLSGFYAFTIRVTDSMDDSAQVNCSILIKRCLVV